MFLSFALQNISHLQSPLNFVYFFKFNIFLMNKEKPKKPNQVKLRSLEYQLSAKFQCLYSHSLLVSCLSILLTRDFTLPKAGKVWIFSFWFYKFFFSQHHRENPLAACKQRMLLVVWHNYSCCPFWKNILQISKW